MIRCTTCGSSVVGRSYKKHKTSIKHQTYEKMLAQHNSSSNVANLADVADINNADDEVFDIDEIHALYNNGIIDLSTSSTQSPSITYTSSSLLSAQAVSHHNELLQVYFNMCIFISV